MFLRGRYGQFAPPTRVHRVYKEIVNRQMLNYSKEKAGSDMPLNVEGDIRRLKRVMKKIFDKHWEAG